LFLIEGILIIYVKGTDTFIFSKTLAMSIFKSTSSFLGNVELGGTLSLDGGGGLGQGNTGSLGGAWGTLFCLAYTCNSFF